MDEDIVFPILFLCLFLTFPFVLITSILSCIACSRTRAWKKDQRRLRLRQYTSLPDPSNPNQPLVDPESQDEADEEEDDYLDTEDEADAKAVKAEALADRHLTTGQKFRKEFVRAWRGNGVKDATKQREREERRKVAKAVAREIERRERRRDRRERRAGRSGAGAAGAEDGLPRYEAAVSGDRKQ